MFPGPNSLLRTNPLGASLLPVTAGRKGFLWRGYLLRRRFSPFITCLSARSRLGPASRSSSRW